MPAPVLWSWDLSPFAGKVRVAFAEKGVDVELHEIHPVKRPERLRELNPLARVPVLEVDGSVLRESSVICEWLEETHPDPPLWPADAGERGWARGWAKYLDDEVAVSFFLGLRKQAFGLDDADPPDLVERLHGKLVRRWSQVEALLAERSGPWVCGEQLTYADLSGSAVAVRVHAWRPDLLPDPEELPLTHAWLEALRARPSAAQIEAKGAEVDAAA